MVQKDHARHDPTGDHLAVLLFLFCFVFYNRKSFLVSHIYGRRERCISYEGGADR